MILIALLAWIVTAYASLGDHSRVHNWIARIAMLLEGMLLSAAITGGPRVGLAMGVGACFVAVAVTDTNRRQMAIVQWIRERRIRC